MNKKIILALAAATLLTSSLLASGPQNGANQGNNPKCNQQNMMQSQGNKKDHGIVKMFMKLDLSPEQRTTIREIMKETMNSQVTPAKAFTDNSFDKKAFVELAEAKKNTKIQRKADMIEKIYAVLTPAQKKDFRTMLDMKEVMKKNMMQDCNGMNCKNKK